MPKPRTRLKHQLFKSQARTAACSILANALPTQSGEAIVFRPIDALALDAFNGWGDGVHFSWEEVPLWKAREPWSFDLSIWCGSELCGLCFANPNQSRLRTKIIRLEGNPDIRHPTSAEKSRSCGGNACRGALCAKGGKSVAGNSRTGPGSHEGLSGTGV